MSVDANKEIRRAVDTGEVVFGTKVTKKKLLWEKEKCLCEQQYSFK